MNRRFNPLSPDALWLADFTNLATWTRFDIAFVFDVYPRRILGWMAATSMRTDSVLDALEILI